MFVLTPFQDEDLQRKVKIYSQHIADCRAIDNPRLLERTLTQIGSTVLFFDLFGSETRTLLPQIVKAWPDTIVIALGVPRSDPMRDAEALEIYACEDIDIDRRVFQNLVTRALDFLKVVQENQMLKEQTLYNASASPVVTSSKADAGLSVVPLQHFSRALRNFEDLDVLLSNTAEAVASSARVTRVGIFSRLAETGCFALRAGLKCVERADQEQFTDEDPLIQWMEINAHVVARSTLDFVQDHRERLMLKRALDSLGAEVIVPLQSRGKLLGWFFLGHRITGMPFEVAELEDLMTVADHISITLENATLYEEVAVQKTRAETLLHAMPTGIISVSDQGQVRWFNEAAERILGVSAEAVLNKSVDSVGSRIADRIYRSLRGEDEQEIIEWYDQIAQKHVALQTQRLTKGDACIGALALIRDTTADRILQEKQDRLDRATFWTELAASMSHEVRNPLVAIKTFAQLLQERYEDPEFREQFGSLVEREVGRLDGMVNQINDFAHPPELTFKPVDVKRIVKKSLNVALLNFPDNEISCEISLPDHLSEILGDEDALMDCFSHLASNAIEAVADQSDPRISVSARTYKASDDKHLVEVFIHDNGKGIAPDLKEKLFSPFSTTKARGMGLGLPIANRIVHDHNGLLNVETDKKGTCVSVSLPAIVAEKKVSREKPEVKTFDRIKRRTGFKAPDSGFNN